MTLDEHAPPRLARWVLSRASPRATAAFVLSDFHEEFESVLAQHGVRTARRWYWAETLRSVFPLAAQRIRGTKPAEFSVTGDPMLRTIWGDVRYAIRLHRHRPIASLAIIMTMILAVGSTTAVFTAMNAIVLRPLPFAMSERVVELQGTVRDGRVIQNIAYPDLLDFRNRVRSFEAVTAYSRDDRVLRHGADPRLIQTVRIDGEYARIFGLRTAFGRLFMPSDMQLGGPSVAVLSHEFWTSEFGSDRNIVGRTITLDDEPVEVIGVLERGAYTHPNPAAEAITPLIIRPNTPMVNRGAMWALASARLRPGVTVEEARRDLHAVAHTVAVEFPAANTGIGATLRTAHEAVVGPVAPMLELLALAVAAVLLIACVNVANLIFGHAQLRAREFAVRCALGGGPSRLRQQVLTESLMLAVVGGALGAALSPLLTRVLIAVYPDSLPRSSEVFPDVRVIVVGLAVTLFAGLLAALPAMQRASRLTLTNDLRADGRVGGGQGERRIGRVLIGSQVAASLTLLFGAALLLQTFVKLSETKPGFESRGAVAFRVYATPSRYPTAADFARYYQSATEGLQRIPGVRAVSSMVLLPFSGSRFFDVFIQEERGDLGPQNPSTAISAAAPGFDRALGLPVLRGRSFNQSDDSSSAPVVIINEALAKRNYPGTSPVGKFITWNAKEHWQIVGVVGSSSLNQVWEEPVPILYVPVTQAPRRGRHFIIRSDLPPGQVLASARTVLRAIDPTIALTDVATMDERIYASLGPQRFRAMLITALGILALVLAVVGIYGVVANAVTSRTREIGIRMALGESRADVARRVMMDAMGIAAIGLSLGTALALLGGKWLATFLIGVSPHDVRLLAAAASVLCLLVAIAAFGPARRASRVDPMTALRSAD